eukprot:1161573-Amphidinium_carterae.1
MFADGVFRIFQTVKKNPQPTKALSAMRDEHKGNMLTLWKEFLVDFKRPLLHKCELNMSNDYSCDGNDCNCNSKQI